MYEDNYQLCKYSGLFLPLLLDDSQIHYTRTSIKKFNRSYMETGAWEIDRCGTYPSKHIILYNSDNKPRFMKVEDFMSHIKENDCILGEVCGTIKFKKIGDYVWSYFL